MDRLKLPETIARNHINVQLENFNSKKCVIIN